MAIVEIVNLNWVVRGGYTTLWKVKSAFDNATEIAEGGRLMRTDMTLASSSLSATVIIYLC